MDAGHVNKNSENKYRRLVEMSPDLVLLCNQRGEILYVNLAGLELLGFENHQQLLGHNIEEIVHPSSFKDVKERLTSLFEGSGDLPFTEELFLRADGKQISMEMKGYLFAYENEYVAHLVVRDITKRKEAEAAKRSATRKFIITALFTFLVVVFAGGYQVYHYTESVGFCGKSCHSVMEPEYALHMRSPHAHITCSQCHIGEGAQWYVKAKLSGLSQVYAVLANTFPKPIPAPIHNLRPASETCEHCHSSKVFHGNRIKLIRRVPDHGKTDNPEVTALLLRIGGYRAETGKYTGIHWHAGMKEKLEYLAVDDKRLQIHDVRVTRLNGKVEHYSLKDKPASAKATWRQMDCSDCHNRTAHNYKDYEEVVDDLLLNGQLQSSLPALKEAALASLKAEYPSRETARKGIFSTLADFYKNNYPQLALHTKSELEQVAKILYSEAYAYNVYPQLIINWNTYTNHIGHQNDYGCFRCHDEQHETKSGKTISQDCEMCHSVLVDGIKQSEIDPQIKELLF